MNHRDYSHDYIKDILSEAKTIAIVGFSANPDRPSHDVARYLQRRGYRIIPVNSGLEGQTILEEPVYATLRDIPIPVDMVDIFRRSEEVPPIIDDAIAIKVKSVWKQIGVRHDFAAAKAEQAGLKVVMGLCSKIELMRLSL